MLIIQNGPIEVITSRQGVGKSSSWNMNWNSNTYQRNEENEDD